MDKPLFSNNSPDGSDTPGYILPPKTDPVAPLSPPDGINEAADLIRDKLAKIYAEEPDAQQEIREADVAKPMSKHQRFMHRLSQSGKDLAEIQTEWHNYYVSLPDDEKRQVWQEFYESNSRLSHAPAQPLATPPPEHLAAHKNQVVRAGRQRSRKFTIADGRSPEEIRTVIRQKVTAGGKLTVKHHLQSLAFGLGLGFIVVFVFMFGFFNEIFITPFIQPSRHASAAPLIVSGDSVAPTTTPEVIIPKINVEIPADYSQTSTDEATIENALKDGVVHYPTTTLPGQLGNTAFFGHSSNNIFSPGKYKFAFVLLHELVPGDTFYLSYNNKIYVYKVFSKTIVDPSDVGVLDPVSGHNATATLITCDPPGTSWRRLIVVGDQISPDPSANSKATAPITQTATGNLPGNGPTLWSRWWGSGYGKTVTILIVMAGAVWVIRRLELPVPLLGKH